MQVDLFCLNRLVSGIFAFLLYLIENKQNKFIFFGMLFLIMAAPSKISFFANCSIFILPGIYYVFVILLRIDAK